jgi:hypothetical protein
LSKLIPSFRASLFPVFEQTYSLFLIIGGILSSTVLTLWFIPAIERLITSRVRYRARKGNSK